MRCPQCKKAVQDDAQICEHCDFILDASFLGDLEGGADGGDEDGGHDSQVSAAPEPDEETSTAPRARAPAPSRAPARPAYYDAQEEEPAPPPARSRGGPMAPSRGAAAGAGPSPKRRFQLDVEDNKVSRETDDFLQQLWTTFQELPGAERVGVAAIALLFFMLLMPWRSTALDGDEIGLFADAWPVGLAALLATGAAWTRITGQYRWRFERIHTIAAQALAGLLASGTALVRMILDTDLRMVKNALGSSLESASHPHVGALFTLLLGVAVMGAAFTCWKDPASPT